MRTWCFRKSQSHLTSLLLQKSFAQITRCSIATKLEFFPSDGASQIEANVTSMSWKVALDNPDFKIFPEQEYYFDTSMPSWVQVPSDLTNEPTPAPTSAPVNMSSEPTMVLLSLEGPTVSPSLQSNAVESFNSLATLLAAQILTLIAIVG